MKLSRKPFGIASAPEIFQQKLDMTLSGLEWMKAVVEDSLIYRDGDTVEEAESKHCRLLVSLLVPARKHGLRFSLFNFSTSLEGSSVRRS